jgi:hypothetical protein
MLFAGIYTIKCIVYTRDSQANLGGWVTLQCVPESGGRCAVNSTALAETLGTYVLQVFADGVQVLVLSSSLSLSLSLALSLSIPPLAHSLSFSLTYLSTYTLTDPVYTDAGTSFMYSVSITAIYTYIYTYIYIYICMYVCMYTQTEFSPVLVSIVPTICGNGEPTGTRHDAYLTAQHLSPPCSHSIQQYRSVRIDPIRNRRMSLRLDSALSIMSHSIPFVPAAAAAAAAAAAVSVPFGTAALVPDGAGSCVCPPAALQLAGGCVPYATLVPAVAVPLLALAAAAAAALVWRCVARGSGDRGTECG